MSAAERWKTDLEAWAVPAGSDGDRNGRGSGRDLQALPLARAQRLLAEGTTALAAARRIR